MAPTTAAPMTGTSSSFDSASTGFCSATTAAGVESTGLTSSTLGASTTGAGVESTTGAVVSATRGRDSEVDLSGEVGGEADVKVEGSTEMRAAAAIPAAPRRPEAMAAS